MATLQSLLQYSTASPLSKTGHCLALTFSFRANRLQSRRGSPVSVFAITTGHSGSRIRTRNVRWKDFPESINFRNKWGCEKVLPLHYYIFISYQSKYIDVSILKNGILVSSKSFQSFCIHITITLKAVITRVTL